RIVSIPAPTLGCETTRRTLGRLMAGRYTVVRFRYIGHTPFLPLLSDALYQPKTDSFLVPKRILIADDHLAVREGLRSLIDPDPDFKVVGEAADGNETARKALELRPDLIVLDNSMPGMTGLEVARMLRDNLPQTKIVFLTLDPGIRDLALATGAAAHVSKDQPPQEIMRVVRAAVGITTPKAQATQPSSAQAKLAELLISEKLLTSRQIQDLDRLRTGRQTLSNAILRSGLVDEESFANAVARVSGHPVTSLRVAPEAAVIRQLPRRFCELRAVALVEFGRTSATLAMADPLDEAAEREAKDMLGEIGLTVVTATLTEVRDAIHRAHAPALVPLVAVPTLPQKRTRRRLALVAVLAAALLLIATSTAVLLNQNTVQGTAFQVRIDTVGRTVVSTTDGTVRTFGTDTAVPPVLVAAGMQSTVSQTGPSAASPITDPTLTFTFEDATQAFVVNAAGQAAGTKEGATLRYIPGSEIAQDNGRVVVTIPGSDAGRL